MYNLTARAISHQWALLPATGPVLGPPGYEINLLYIGALLALALTGPGALSVDGWLRSRRK